MSAQPGQIAFGAYINGAEFGGQAPDVPAAIGAFAQLVGRAPASVTWYEDRQHCAGFPTAKCQAVREAGAAPIITWRQNGMGSADIAAGKDDAYYTAFARAAAAWGHSVYLRYDWEFNIAPNGTPAQWAAAWKHQTALFDANGAANVYWIWNPNIEYWGTTDMGLFYPGDQYVDWVALDGYNWGHVDQYHWWSSFTQVFQASYARLQTIAPAKPVMIGETASADNGGDKGAWILNALTVEIPQRFPAVRALTWFNQDKSAVGEQDWRMNSSVGALAGAQAALTATYQPPPAMPPTVARYGAALP